MCISPSWVCRHVHSVFNIPSATACDYSDGQLLRIAPYSHRYAQYAERYSEMCHNITTYGFDEIPHEPYKTVLIQGGGYTTSIVYGRLVGLHRMGLIDKSTQFQGTSAGAFWAVCGVIISGNPDIMSVTDRIELCIRIIILFSLGMEHRLESGLFDYPSFIPYITHSFSVIPDSLYHDISTRVTCMVTHVNIPLTTHGMRPDPSHNGISKTVIASTYIPFWTTPTPVYRINQMHVVDGGFTNNSSSRRDVISRLETDDRLILIIIPPSDIEKHRILIPGNIGTWVLNVFSIRQPATDEVNEYNIKIAQRGISEIVNFVRPITGHSTI